MCSIFNTFVLAPLPGSEAPLVCEIYCHLLLWKKSFEGFVRGIFTSSGTTITTPQPTPPTKNIEYESGMIEQLLANPYAGDGIEHPDMHLIYVEEICGLFKIAGFTRR